MDVIDKSSEANMDFIFLIVNPARRIVRDEYVNSRKRPEHLLNLGLLVEKMSSRFVFPRTVESAEAQFCMTLDVEMQVSNGGEAVAPS